MPEAGQKAAAVSKASSPHLNDLSSHNPFAETAPAKVFAAKVAAAAAALNVGGDKPGSVSSVASSEIDELEAGRDTYRELASFVNGGEQLLARPACAYGV